MTAAVRAFVALLRPAVLVLLALFAVTGLAETGRPPGSLALFGVLPQESALRRLVTSAPPRPGGPADLRQLIEEFSDPRVTVSCPATAVLLPAAAAQALSGATAAALDNVRRHAGPRARAWVLVEDLGKSVRVSIRDDGPGFASGRLARAAAAGRLGVSHSIVGRIRDAGGTAAVRSVPGEGTEVELVVPVVAGA